MSLRVRTGQFPRKVMDLRYEQRCGIPSYYFAETSDSGLSSDATTDVSDDDGRVSAVSHSDEDAEHLYENVPFLRDKTEFSQDSDFPAPPLNFRDSYCHPDWIRAGDNNEDNIEPDNDTEGYGDIVQQDDINTFHPSLSSPLGFSVQTLKKNKVSRNNFVAHCKTERMIVSKEGTVRGIRHRVSKIKMDMMGSLHIDQDKCLLQKQTLIEQEQGQCVVYLTSLGVVRDTIQRCSNVRKILRNLCIRVIEKDLYVRGHFKTELETRLEIRLKKIRLPLVFLNGQFLGDDAELERMNEAGELREMMEPLRDRAAVERVCVGCGGYRVVPCPGCGGSRVGSNMWHGSVKLRCTLCDMSGLVTCQMCSS